MKSLFLLGALAAAPAIVAPAQAQLSARGAFDPLNYSGLRAQTLSVVNTPSGIGGLIKVASPTVMRSSCRMTAKVLEDRPGALVVEVSYTGMPTNVRKLTVMVADAAGTKAVAGIASASQSVSVGEPEATLTFTLPFDPSAAEGALESKRLFVYGLGSQPHIVAVNQMFDCNKRWFKQPSTLVAEPITPLPAQPGATGGPLILAPGTVKILRFRPITKLKVKPSDPPSVFVAPTAVSGIKKAPVFRPQLMRGGRDVAARDVEKPMAFASMKQTNKSLAGMKVASLQAKRPIAFRPELIAKLKVIDPAIFAKPSDQIKGDQGEGPTGESALSFAERIEADPAVVEVARALTISPVIYGDKNENSGLYYYLPARYTLDFSTDSGFLLQMFYAAGTDGSAGEVNVSAILRASVSPADLGLADAFLKEFLKSQKLPSGAPVPYKRLVPFFGNPKASLEGAIAAQLFLDPTKVKVLGVGDGVVNVSLSVSPDKAELFLSRLTSNVGLAGEMSYTSSADPTLTASVPMELKLPDRNSLKLGLSPQNGFKNDSPFPVALKYIHVLRFTNGVPTVYSFNLPDNEISAGGSVSIDRSKIPEWLTAAPAKIWADFQVIPDGASLEKALQTATGASSGATSAQVTVEKVGDFPEGVSAVTVVVTSKYFTPFGSREETQETTLTPTDTSRTLGPIYPNGRQEGVDLGADKPYLKWSLKVVKNGQTLKTALQSSNRLTISVGAEQIGAAR